MHRARQSILALLAAALACTMWLLWPRAGGQMPTGPGTPAAMTGEDDDPEGSTIAAQADAIDDATNDRQLAATEGPTMAADAAQPATLRVSARWPGGAPAREVMLYLRRGERFLPYTASRRGLTDAEGVVVFAGVRPGVVRLASDRGDRTKVDVVPGPQDVAFELRGGVEVRGAVQDPAGRAVAGAEVWLQTAGTTWSDGRVVATTGADGGFTLAQVSPQHSLGALARGFAPSMLVDLDVLDTSTPPVRVVLQLEPNGGSLAGRVVDAAGEAIAGALVAAGKKPRFLDHQGERVIEQWTVRTAETDADGAFRLDGLPTGPRPVAIRADGYGLWRDAVTIQADATTTISPRLQRCAVLTGTVTDGAGEPEVGAVVSVFDRPPKTDFLAGGQIDFDETFGHRAAITGASGSFWIEGITPGTAHAFAQRDFDGRGGVSVAYAQSELRVEPGAEVRWDPVIDDGRSVAGVVLYRDGYPIPDLFITLRDEVTGKEHVLNSGRDGTFRFLCLEAATYEIRVQLWDAPKEQPPLKAVGVVPDRGSNELRTIYDRPVQLEPGAVLGRVDDAGQRVRNPKAARVVLHSDQGWFRDGAKIEAGAFRFTDVEPCRFRLILKEDETTLACTDWFELPAAGRIDVGALTTEPGGGVHITVDRDADSGDLAPKLYLRRDGDASSTAVELGRADELLVDNLTPGEYQLTGYARNMVPLHGAFTVAAATVAEARVALRRGARCWFDVWWPEGHTTTARRGYRILDAGGTVFHEHEGPLSTSPTRPYVMQSTVPPGSWRLEFWTDDGLRGEQPFVVDAALDEVTGRMDLR